MQGRMDRLSPKIQSLWEVLGRVGPRYVLVGGTALSFRIGHRESVDIDLLTSAPADHPRVIAERLGRPVGKHKWLRRRPDHYIKFFATDDAPKIDIHGKSPLPCLADPDTADNGLRIASLTDILLHKLLALSAREECRDLLDLQALAAEAGADADNAGAAVSSGSWGLDRSEADELGQRLSDLRGWGADSGLRTLGCAVLAGLDRAPHLAHRQVQGAP